MVEEEIIGEVPSGAAQVEEPKVFDTQELSIFLIKCSINLPKFTSIKEWCLIAESVIVPAKLKGAVELLEVDMKVLSGKCRFFEMMMCGTPRLVPSSVPEVRPCLQAGSY